MTNAFLNHCIAPRVPSRGSRTRKFAQYLTLLLFGALTGSAVAQSALTYNDGDLFVGFRSTDGTSDYLINIGQPAQFVNAMPGSTTPVAVGNTSADLAAAFGADWYSRIDPNTGRNAVLWGVIGGRQIGASGDPDNALYSTNPLANPWPRRSDSAQSFTTSLITALGNTFAGNNPTSNNPQGLVQSRAGSNSYASFQPGGANSSGISFQTWNPTNEAGPANTLFFDRITPGSGTSTVLGALLLDSSGQLELYRHWRGNPNAFANSNGHRYGYSNSDRNRSATATATAHTPHATATVAPTPTPAGPPLTYNDGDLFLGFRSTDGTSDYLVKIGQPAQFVNAMPGATFQVAVGGTSADLVATFGSDWCTRIDPNTGRNAVLWAVIGGRQIAASGDPGQRPCTRQIPWPTRGHAAPMARNPSPRV